MTAAVETQSGQAILRRIATYVPGSVVPAAITLVTSVVFTRIFNADEFGEYSLVLAIATLAKTGMTLWVTLSIGKYLPATQDAAHRVTIKEAVILSAATVVLIEATIGTGIVLLAHWLFDTQTQPFVLPAVLFVVVTSAFDIVMVLFPGEQRPKPYVSFQLTASAGTFALRLLLVSQLFLMDIQLMLWSVVICNAVLLPLLWRQAHLPSPRILASVMRSDPALSLMRAFVAFGLPMTLWLIASMLLDVGDRFVIDYFLGPSAVGIYDANYRLIAGFVSLMIVPLTITLHPYLMSISGQQHGEHIGEVIGVIVDKIMLLGILSVGLTFVFHEQLALLLGPDFREGSRLMPIVLAGVFVFSIGTFVHKPFEIVGRPKTMVLWAYLAAAVNLGANFVLVPLLGYMGASYATVVAYSAYTIGVGRLGRRLFPWHVDKAFVARRAATIGAVILVIASFDQGLLPIPAPVGFGLAALFSAGLCAWVVRDMIGPATFVMGAKSHE